MIKIKHFKKYIELVKEKDSIEMAKSISKTSKEMVNKYIKNFDFQTSKTGLLLGNVQSGKTAHMLGVLSAAADNDFEIFIIMTSDNTSLQQQTYRRALRSLDTFSVCGEEEDDRFILNDMRKPVVIVIKKNSRVLNTWKKNLIQSQFINSRPIFIIDDEGDAASLNTRTNIDDDFSTINKRISEIRKLANSSFYLQVTATPQSIFLQEEITGHKPEFVYYFKPGNGYLGGDFFYSTGRPYIEPQKPYPIEFTGEEELDELRDDQSYPPEGMLKAITSFLIAASHVFINKTAESCNFLVHPSVRINDHAAVAKKIGEALNALLDGAINDETLKEALKEAWEKLKITKPDIVDFQESFDYISNLLSEGDNLNIYTMNSTTGKKESFNTGINIIIGGNSLGRGLTIPNLQTTYYCRKSKRVQADTVWQHCRSFGYDRDRGLVRIFLPPSLFKNFSEINDGNNAIIEYINEHGLKDLKLIYPRNIRPTRSNVVNKTKLERIIGGVNYFPSFPKATNLYKIDKKIKELNIPQNLSRKEGRKYLKVDVEEIKEILKLCETEDKDNWSAKSYLDCLESLEEKNLQNGILIVRENRDIGKYTGTLLSPTDRKLGDTFKDEVTLTMYRVIGDSNRGWEDGPLWIPNIKLPKGVFYGLKQ